MYLIVECNEKCAHFSFSAYMMARKDRSTCYALVYDIKNKYTYILCTIILAIMYGVGKESQTCNEYIYQFFSTSSGVINYSNCGTFRKHIYLLYWVFYDIITTIKLFIIIRLVLCVTALWAELNYIHLYTNGSYLPEM